jgi:hypothetical protein
MQRMTIPEVVRLIETQTAGKFVASEGGDWPRESPSTAAMLSGCHLQTVCSTPSSASATLHVSRQADGGR